MPFLQYSAIVNESQVRGEYERLSLFHSSTAEIIPIHSSGESRFAILKHGQRKVSMLYDLSFITC